MVVSFAAGRALPEPHYSGIAAIGASVRHQEVKGKSQVLRMPEGEDQEI
jgi:hypothetical protein